MIMSCYRRRTRRAKLLEPWRAHLAPAAFDTAWAEGQRLSLQVVAELTLRLAVREKPVPTTTKTASSALTNREHQVLQRVVRGITNKMIAHQLSISSYTAEEHVSAIVRKLECTTRTEATRYAVEHGLIASAHQPHAATD